MKIAYFNASLRKGQDGVTRVIYRIVEEAVKRGHKAIGVTSALPEPGDRIIPMLQVPSVSFPLQSAYRVALPGYQSFAKFLLEFEPDIIHVNSPCTLGFAAAKFSRHFGIPIVATYHTHFPSYPRYYRIGAFEVLTWTILRRFYREIDQTFVPTMPILKELENHAIGSLRYLPNGVDTTLFNPSRRSEVWRKLYTNGRDIPIVLFVSRLVWEKDLRVLAEAYNLLRRRRDDFAMVVVGDGHARRELEQMMPGAHFLGFRTGLDLATCYASSDIFVFPSTTETFGLVTVEAMASGAVPVAAQAGGALGIIEDGISGMFSKPRDVSDTARLVELLIDRPDARKTLSAGAVTRSAEFRWESILGKLFQSYEEVINEFRNKRSNAA